MTDKKNLAAALIKAQVAMTPAYKDKDNPAFRGTKYATLTSVQEACIPALGANGIAVMQSVGTEWNEHGVLVKVGCTFYHADSGESIINEIALLPTKQDPQGIGSAITYGRRYLLMAMAGIAPEDDDGNAASGQPETKKQANTQRQPVTTPTPANGHSNTNAAPTVEQANSIVGEAFVAKVIADWKTPADAYKWAADGGFTENEHSARTRWSEIVKQDFGNACNTSNVKAVMRAFATHYFNKQAAKVAA